MGNLGNSDGDWYAELNANVKRIQQFEAEIAKRDARIEKLRTALAN